MEVHFMSKKRASNSYRSLSLLALLALPIAACGGGGSATTPPAVEALDTASISSALPRGVTLETPVRADKLYGESSKTVQDALKNLVATVKDHTIYDALGKEIVFDSPGKAAPKPAKGKRAQVVVHLAN
jgi:hypothetical protein